MQSQQLDITALDMEGRGIGHLGNPDGSPGKVVFVEGALPGERVIYDTVKRKANWESGVATSIMRASSQRVTPRCPFFGVCGGCAMQHLEASTQVAVKQRTLEDNLWHIGRVRAENILSPIYGPTWGYRYRARISVRHVRKKGKVLVGFHERRSTFVSDMESCEILPRRVSDLLVPLRRLIETLSLIDHLPQIELAVGETENGLRIVMVLRIMRPMAGQDEELLKAFADQHGVHWWLQTGSPDTAAPYYPKEQDLYYSLPEFGVKMPFKPTDFTQVNHQINRVLVSRALRLLAPQEGERVVDMFCGLGNFTLPIATLASEVVGIEGSRALVERAGENAKVNRLERKTRFIERNLFEITTDEIRELGYFDRMLIDPPRDGALSLVQALAGLVAIDPALAPRRLVYVSCNPGTLARDAAVLVAAGYRLRSAGVINMFPHTAHVESMAVFER